MRARRVLLARDMGSMRLGRKGRERSGTREKRENPELNFNNKYKGNK
jgi:hypothetical protein